VAIATALMPPLCTAGYGLGTGNYYYFLGAFYLFVINCVFISISTFLIIRFLKFKPVNFINKSTEVKVRRYVWIIAVLTILPSVYLAYNFVQQEIFKQNVRTFTHDVLETNNFYVINEKMKPAKQEVFWLLYGEKPLDSLFQIIELRKSGYGLGNAKFHLRQTLNPATDNNKIPVLQNESSPLIEQHTALLIEKDKTIRGLEKRIRSFEQSDTSLYREFYALYGEINAIGVQRSVIRSNKSLGDSVMLVYINKKGKFNRKQIESWLKARFSRDSVIVVFE
jgi:uncharacterized membrane protein